MGVVRRGGVGELHAGADENFSFFHYLAGGFLGKRADVDTSVVRQGFIEHCFAPKNRGKGEVCAGHKVIEFFDGVEAFSHNIGKHSGLLALEELGCCYSEVLFDVLRREAGGDIQGCRWRGRGSASYVDGEH